MKYNKEKFNELKEKVSRLEQVELAKLPTPLDHTPNLSRVLNGPQIYFKRDDLTGLAVGGNKARMFDFTMAKVIKDGHDCVVGGSAVQSNYSRQMAASCAKLGLDCHLVLRPVRGERDFTIEGNLLLDLLLGANVTIIKPGDSSEEQKRVAHKIAEKLRHEGRNPYICRGISNLDVGYDSVAYVAGFLELIEQAEEQGVDIDYIYVGSTDTTYAGLLYAAEYISADIKIVGFNPLSKDFSTTIPEEQVYKIGKDIAKILGSDFLLQKDRIAAISDYVGEGYGKVTDIGLEAIKLVGSTEGILIEPIYTGKAVSGLIDHIKTGKLTNDDAVVFWHTGGTPALFAYAEQLQLSLTSKNTVHKSS